MKYTLSELKKLSKKISKKVKIGLTIYLKGDLGSGKTTLTKFLVADLYKKHQKKKQEVTSPTFNIVQYYYVNTKLVIAHYDLYRLKSSQDLNHIGLYEIEDSVVSIIEWPELIKKKNKDRIEIEFKHTSLENKRDVTVKYFGKAKQ